ncbi:MAG: hypothetical protein WC551_11110 [Patescibacteria group bacterium]
MRFVIAFVSRLTGREGTLDQWLTKWEAKDRVRQLQGRYLGYEYWLEKV